MVARVVKYHNDFNQVYLGKLNAAEINLAFDIIARVKDKGTKPITFTVAELKKNLPKNYSQHEFSLLVNSLRRKFFKLDFTVITEYEDKSTDEDIYNLFRRLTIHRNKEKEVIAITIQVDEFFKYLVNNIKVNFTRYELEELFQIRGAYAKKIYRLLKQFRHKGEFVIAWDKFCEHLGIEAKKPQRDINKYILNPAMAELSEIRIVNGEERPTFKNIAFEKLTTPGQGRKITAIKFIWEPEQRVKEQVTNKQPIAQKACPYAEGTDAWYIWHHIDPVSKVPENSQESLQEGHQIIELEATEPKQDDKQSNFKGPKDLNEFCEALNEVTTKADLDVLENYINENKELFKENLEMISVALTCARDRLADAK